MTSNLGIFAFLLLVHGTAFAGWRDLQMKDFPIADPPTRGSETDRLDLAEVLRQNLPENLDQKICDWAYKHGDYTFESLYLDLLTPEEIKKAKPLLDAVFTMQKRIVDDMKK